MLDTSIPWYRVKREPGTRLPPGSLPAGYTFASYQQGDKQAWAEIETSAGTFDTVEDAVAYFRHTFVPYLDEVERRTFLPKWWMEKRSRTSRPGGDVQESVAICLCAGSLSSPISRDQV
jgi:hypothetical protein